MGNEFSKLFSISHSVIPLKSPSAVVLEKKMLPETALVILIRSLSEIILGMQRNYHKNPEEYFKNKKSRKYKKDSNVFAVEISM